MSVSRRQLLLGMLAGSFGALSSRLAHAIGAIHPPAWPRKAFASKTLDGALGSVLGGRRPADSNQITLDIPDLAEDGTVVPVSISTTLPGAESILLLAEKNPTPLLAEFLLTPELEPFVSTHIKLGATGPVWAVVRAQGKSYVARKSVKVTVGGCG